MPIPGISLLGFMERRTALNYLRQSCYLPGRSETQLKLLWQAAGQQRGEVVGTPGDPELLDLPSSADPHVAAVMAHARFPETCAGMPHTFRLVEIHPLLAFQFHVLDNAIAVCDPANGVPDLATMLDICLPLTERIVSVSPAALTGDGFVIRSDDMNARPLEIIPGADHHGRPVVGFSIAERSAFVHVVRWGGRAFLKNGYHRARALALAGVTHMPAIVLDATRFDEVGLPGKGFSFDQSTLAKRDAPTCGHLVDGRAYAVPIRRHGHVIEVRLLPHGEALE